MSLVSRQTYVLVRLCFSTLNLNDYHEQDENSIHRPVIVYGRWNSFGSDCR